MNSNGRVVADKKARKICLTNFKRMVLYGLGAGCTVTE